ncbi:hypothetical protein [Paraliobacillus ryukyuensis]|uniref:hypothetical protein n=1 Tax=Paraliobacillus ryukyuensis TaxID=200904 RepID=UPI0009A7B1D9|nr:hypothetical protein [Paraliobacillus ryukyuensis]
MDLEEIAITIRDAIRDLPELFQENNERLSEIDMECQDLLHLLELTEFNARDGYKISKEMQVLQRERRQIKDQNEQLAYLKPVLSSWRDRLQQLEVIIGNIHKTKKLKEIRRYRCRVRKDLESKINTVKPKLKVQ